MKKVVGSRVYFFNALFYYMIKPSGDAILCFHTEVHTKNCATRLEILRCARDDVRCALDDVRCARDDVVGSYKINYKYKSKLASVIMLCDKTWNVTANFHCVHEISNLIEQDNVSIVFDNLVLHE